ncbi:hypothetical protein [Polyangium jinanense]|uniref:Transposase n=1 Tax=Polyangium jinanense TaxID=2829994 RepID=A0A9X3X161_9BACT|nr:hypothetical protein [Polyangium jinanense]MDC3955570.1 hypothetical protein [Polyangium jinanense]MDC3982212.1 hypothetical protein [Polyangium jinanense]
MRQEKAPAGRSDADVVYGVVLKLLEKNAKDRGLAMNEPNDRVLALEALERALRARRPAHHSDRGSPYASDDDRQVLRERGIAASMSRAGDL